MSKYKNSKQSFTTIKQANKYISFKKGECVILPYRNGYKVKYERALNECKINAQKYCTIKFSAVNTADSFCKKLKKEGFITNDNQDVSVKTISDRLFTVRFILTKPKICNKYKNDDYHNEWVKSNLDGSFAYNNITEDF